MTFSMLEDLINQTHLCLFVCVCAVTQQVRPLWVRPQLIGGRPLLVNIHNNNSNAKRGSEKMKLMSPRAGWRVWRVLLLATNVAALCIWSIICINIDTTLSHTHTHLTTHPYTRVNVENDDALVVAALLLLRLLLYL